MRADVAFLASDALQGRGSATGYERIAAEYIGANALKGTPQQVIDRIGEYRDAGAEMVILALRAPFDVDGLDRFAAEVLPAFA